MLKLGYALRDTRTPRRICRIDDPAVDLDATPEAAKAAYRERGDCSGLVLTGTPTWWTWTVVRCADASALWALAKHRPIARLVYAARLVLELPGYRWTDAEGVEHEGLPREEEDGYELVADDFLRQNPGTVELCYHVGKLALGSELSDVEKKV